MSKQLEDALEKDFIKQLDGLGYKYVPIKNEDELLINLKKQIEIHNEIELSKDEFKKVLNHLNDGGIVKRSHILRDWFALKRDDGTTKRIRFFNMEKWCENEYQVTNQISMEGNFKNRYDVTLLINGLPLVQIELKRSGVALKEAFNQINRYQKDSFWASHGLFQYVQMFVISNRVNTKYFANDPDQTFKQTFFWTDEDNNSVSDPKEFTKVFLEPCHLSTMIGQYIVINETEKKLNTLYVDKNLQYHGLIQAFSRTNRVDTEQKSQGNIVCFRNLKDQTDEAIALFNDEEANEFVENEDVFLASYDEYLEKFEKALESLKDYC